MGPDEGSGDMQMWPHRGIHICVQLCKEREANTVRHVGIYTCTDACPPSGLAVRPEEGLLGHAHGTTQRHTYLDATMQRGGTNLGSQV